MGSKPRILLLDIETAPHRVFAWGLRDQDVHLDQIEAVGYTLCWSAKWLGERKMHFRSIHADGRRRMLRAIYDLLREADVVVHYNGTRFDLPTLNQEFLALGWGPPEPYQQVDLLLAVRRQFRLASNKLDFVARALGLGEKMAHKGMELWRGCMDGDAGAWRTMERYNKRDVELLERLYARLLPWIPQHPNVGMWARGERPVCPNCGSKRVERRGAYHSRTRAYQRWSCRECGKWMRSRTAEKDTGPKVVGVE